VVKDNLIQSPALFSGNKGASTLYQRIPSHKAPVVRL